MHLRIKPVTWLRAVALAASLGAAGAVAAQGLDLTLIGGADASSHANVKKLGVIGGYTPISPLWQGGNWTLRFRNEVELSYWRVKHARDIVEFGYSPFLRLEHPWASSSAKLFVEASIGARLLSHHRLSAQRNMSSSFQFSDQVGAGVDIGSSTVGVRFQHLSNAGIKHPNPGINFVNLYYSHKF